MRPPWQSASQFPLVGKHSLRCIAIARDEFRPLALFAAPFLLLTAVFPELRGGRQRTVRSVLQDAKITKPGAPAAHRQGCLPEAVAFLINALINCSTVILC